MPSPSPWSIKGISPEARRLAKDAAHKRGMTLGAWMTEQIAQAHADDAPSDDQPTASDARVPSQAIASPLQQSEPNADLGQALSDIAAILRDVEDRAGADHAAVSRVDARLRAAETATASLGEKVETLATKTHIRDVELDLHMESLKAQIADARGEADDARARVDDLSADLAAHRAEIDGLAAAVDTRADRDGALEETLRDLASAVDSGARRAAATETAVKKMADALQIVDGSIEATRARADEAIEQTRRLAGRNHGPVDDAIEQMLLDPRTSEMIRDVVRDAMAEIAPATAAETSRSAAVRTAGQDEPPLDLTEPLTLGPAQMVSRGKPAERQQSGPAEAALFGGVAAEAASATVQALSEPSADTAGGSAAAADAPTHGAAGDPTRSEFEQTMAAALSDADMDARLALAAEAQRAAEMTPDAAAPESFADHGDNVRPLMQPLSLDDVWDDGSDDVDQERDLDAEADASFYADPDQIAEGIEPSPPEFDAPALHETEGPTALAPHDAWTADPSPQAAADAAADIAQWEASGWGGGANRDPDSASPGLLSATELNDRLGAVMQGVGDPEDLEMDPVGDPLDQPGGFDSDDYLGPTAAAETLSADDMSIPAMDPRDQSAENADPAAAAPFVQEDDDENDDADPDDRGDVADLASADQLAAGAAGAAAVSSFRAARGGGPRPDLIDEPAAPSNAGQSVRARRSAPRSASTDDLDMGDDVDEAASARFGVILSLGLLAITAGATIVYISWLGG